MKHASLLALPLLLSACATGPKAPEPIYIMLQPTLNCTPIGQLKAVQVPPETRTMTAIVGVEGGDQRSEQITQTIREGYTEYRNVDGVRVDNVCELDRELG